MSTARPCRRAPRRFYAKADTAPADGGFAVRLDGRTPRSPKGAAAGRCRPSRWPRLAAEEWAAQGEKIQPGDDARDAAGLGRAGAGRRGRARRRGRGVVGFAGSDLLCYFADGPAGLVERQERRWGAGDRLGRGRRWALPFHRTQGIVHQPQPPATLARIEAARRGRGRLRTGGPGRRRGPVRLGDPRLRPAAGRADAPRRPSSSPASTRPSRKNAGASTPKPPRAPTPWRRRR